MGIEDRMMMTEHAVLEPTKAWITYRKKNGKGLHSGTIATNPDYIKAHNDWEWLPITLPEIPRG